MLQLFLRLANLSGSTRDQHTAEPHPVLKAAPLPHPAPNLRLSPICPFLKNSQGGFHVTRNYCSSATGEPFVSSQLPSLPSCAICQVSKNTLRFPRTEPHTITEPLALPVPPKCSSQPSRQEGMVGKPPRAVSAECLVIGKFVLFHRKTMVPL